MTPVLLVAGLGRCGTSAMMQALQAGGIPTVGDWPAFEPAEAGFPVDPGWLAAQAGRAVKVLEPHRSPAAMKVPHLAIWMERNLNEQARSQIKMVAALSVAGATATRRERRLMSEALKHDTRKALALLHPVIARVEYEDLVERPVAVMHRIARRLPPGWRLDPEKAAAVIHRRDPRCAPGLDMEIGMVEAAEARR